MIVFVYGSLKRDKNLHSFLKNARFLREAYTKDKYPLILSRYGWYPYMLAKNSKGKLIKGELYEINYNTLKNLDRLEEVPFYYKRIKIRVKAKKTMVVWSYIYAKKKKFLKRELLIEF
ncbi:MAG: gamma-glutamylcyclotransferase family protein [Nautiliaceae bacterium]